MHISRRHGITRCRRVPDKAPPLKNGPSYLSHEPLMGPIPRRIVVVVVVFILVLILVLVVPGPAFSLFRTLRPGAGANLHLTPAPRRRRFIRLFMRNSLRITPRRQLADRAHRRARERKSDDKSVASRVLILLSSG